MRIDARVTVNKYNESNVVAFASITIDDCFVVKDLRLVEGKNGLFIGFPSRRTNDGEYTDICFPITKEAREEITAEVKREYEKACRRR